MNANGNLVVDFRINGKHDHYINKEKHVQPHQPKNHATKPKKLIHRKFVINETKEEKL